MIELYKSPWRLYFEDAIQSAEAEVTIVTPFIKTAEAKRVCDAISNLKLTQPLRLRVLTNLRSDSVLAGALDLEALKIFQASTHNLELVTLPRLHAKVYIVDRSLAIVGSANLTSSALDANYEYSVGIRDHNTISQIHTDMLSYAELGSPLSKQQVNELSEITQELASEYNNVQKSVSTPLKKRFNEALKHVNFKFAQAFVGQKSSNAVFSSAVLRVLTTGPKPTKEIHAYVKQLLPELCDDTVELVINGERYGKAWKHQVRNAQQSLKSKGLIYLVNHHWHSAPGADDKRKGAF